MACRGNNRHTGSICSPLSEGSEVYRVSFASSLLNPVVLYLVCFNSCIGLYHDHLCTVDMYMEASSMSFNQCQQLSSSVRYPVSISSVLFGCSCTDFFFYFLHNFLFILNFCMMIEDGEKYRFKFLNEFLMHISASAGWQHGSTQPPEHLNLSLPGQSPEVVGACNSLIFLFPLHILVY